MNVVETLFFSAFVESSDIKMFRQTGLTSAHFSQLLNDSPSLQTQFKSKKNSVDALHMFLMKMRSGMPLADIALAFNVSAATVAVRLRKVRHVLENDFVPLHLNMVHSREDLINHTTTMCRVLFCESESRQTVLIFDGTYIFIERSSNYEFQRDTYTDQKKRNFLKFMMCVLSDGYILHALGPYEAKNNYAKILRSLQETTNKLQYLQTNDVLILDRGFRDCVTYF